MKVTTVFCLFVCLFLSPGLDDGLPGLNALARCLVAVVGDTLGLRLMESELFLEGPCGEWEETDASASRTAGIYNTWSCAFGALERLPFVRLK